MNLRSCSFVLAMTSLLLISCEAQRSPTGLQQVKVEGGIISGATNTTNDVYVFKGIPFAAPPIGPLRWKAPQPVERWKGVRECVDFGPSPMQGKPSPFSVYTSEFLIPESPISEDCLYLNIWTGAKSVDEKRPVLVWIYGGGFGTGGSAVPIYDGEALAKKGVVLISFNYRVGAFGFFVHPQLSNETDYNGSGNYGLMDQIAALKWIKKNISAFGGDPGNVTIAGQSAGAMSVNALVASPLAKGLFHKAIAESGSLMLRKGFIRTSPLKSREEEGLRITKEANINSIEELRKLSAEEIQTKVKGWFTPVIDGYVLPKPIPEIFDSKNYSDVPLLTGWNNDETFTPVTSTEEFRKRVAKNFGDNATTVLTYYPINTEEQSKRSQVELGRDESFGLSNYAWAKIHSDGNSDVYVYNFLRKPPATPDFVKFASFHTAEVPYVFNTLPFFNRPLEKEDYQLAEVMSSYWVNFARTGNPNGEGLPEWPAFEKKDAVIMNFDVRSASGRLRNKEALDFLFDKFK
jgi:para-nitrobenzyl esterase